MKFENYFSSKRIRLDSGDTIKAVFYFMSLKLLCKSVAYKGFFKLRTVTLIGFT